MSPEKIVESVLKAFDQTVIIAGSLDKGIPENAVFKHVQSLLKEMPSCHPLWESMVCVKFNRQRELNLKLGHIAVFVDAIPSNFTHWDSYVIVDKRSLSVAALAAILDRLPRFFDQWELSDETGWSVAHTYASYRDMPNHFLKWNLKNKNGVSVREVQEHRNNPERPKLG